MATSYQQNQKNVVSVKKILLPLVLLTLLAYLAVTYNLTGNSDGNAVVQQAEALVIEGVSPGTDAPVVFGAPTGPNPFFNLHLSEPIPIPATIEPENIATSTDQLDNPGTDAAREIAPGEIAVMIEPLLEPAGEASNTTPESDPATLIPTYSWINAFGTRVVLNGAPVPVGSIVTAYDPDGVLIGRAIITTAGEYGAMPLYMDDPSSQIDEGATSGDLITFKINGLPTVVLGPNEPVWTDNGGLLVLNLAAGEAPVSD